MDTENEWFVARKNFFEKFDRAYTDGKDDYDKRQARENKLKTLMLIVWLGLALVLFLVYWGGI